MLLTEGWLLHCLSNPTLQPLRFDFPNDVHSVLLQAGLISDPYWRDNETKLDWVHEAEWLAEHHFKLSKASGHYTLNLAGLDCVAVVRLNGVEIGQYANQFLSYHLEITDLVQEGDNCLQISFLSNSKTAAAQHAAFPFPVPYLKQNCRLGHYNFLRKTQCHAGWDWNIALSPIGLYERIELQHSVLVRLDEILLRQHHDRVADMVRLEVSLFYQSWSIAEVVARLDIAGRSVAVPVQAYPGANQARLSIEIKQPRLWWPAGHGEQYQYPLQIRLHDQVRELWVGLREVTLLSDKDEVGHRFAFRVNGREIFMRGANWIPADALPARITPALVRDRLQSARDANMNMLRIWGGGQYEPDWFYQQCSELGLLVWQDFMFACNLYPAADRLWLASVRLEAAQQVRRLSQHACLALWCGDNELVGALNWFPESRANRDRYLAMYDRLNHALEEVVLDAAVDVPFWPSSPSVGCLNFGDGWHDDRSGDMHFWDVWHEAKDFEHYRSVQPRFCSEFGFQSFPSRRLMETFTEAADRNISSAVLEVHQRNIGGNGRIVETLARYFRFPDHFEHMLYLSQVGQGLAMKTAIEYWRANKPRCMGTLYWQLNDTWPVASWASLEYGGGWKVTHYLARRFFAPVLITAQPDTAAGDIVLLAVNDLPEPVTLSLSWQRVSVNGAVEVLGSTTFECTPERALAVGRVALSALEGAFLLFHWTDGSGKIQGENEYLPKRPKQYAFLPAAISATPKVLPDGTHGVELCSTELALYVTYDHGGARIYSDNCVTLLPNQPRFLTVERERGGGEVTNEVWSLLGRNDWGS